MNLNNYLIAQKGEKIFENWFITSILYASYNCVLLIPVLISIKELIKKPKNIKYISIIVSGIVIILLITVFLFLINVRQFSSTFYIFFILYNKQLKL